jgi:predicted AlkP superfamily phosphohydrolase/phosphomutase
MKGGMIMQASLLKEIVKLKKKGIVGLPPSISPTISVAGWSAEMTGMQ